MTGFQDSMKMLNKSRDHYTGLWIMALFSCGILVGAVSCVSPEVKEQQADEKRILQVTDSLSATGEHGYYVATYIVGRYKTSRVEKATFDVSVSRMDEGLVERPIRFLVLDTLRYQLSYSLGSRKIQVAGTFHKVLDSEGIEILVSPPSDLDSAAYRRMISNYSVFENVLRVFKY